jgi:CheY-like chemotaxis protein
MTNQTQKKLEILIVEDNSLHQESARILFAEAGYRVEILSDFRGAINQIRAGNNYDVVLTAQSLGKGLTADTGLLAGYGVANAAIEKNIPLVGILAEQEYAISAYGAPVISKMGNSKLGIFKFNTAENTRIPEELVKNLHITRDCYELAENSDRNKIPQGGKKWLAALKCLLDSNI